MSNIVGSFYFKDEGEGCIMGKYFNTGLNSPLIESAKIKDPLSLKTNKKFCGLYSTIWLDDIDDPNECDLNIQPKGNELYFLVWTSRKTTRTMYYGEAMIVGEILIGCYWNPSVNPSRI